MQNTLSDSLSYLSELEGKCVLNVIKSGQKMFYFTRRNTGRSVFSLPVILSIYFPDFFAVIHHRRFGICHHEGPREPERTEIECDTSPGSC
jgi:hypothetical protein